MLFFNLLTFSIKLHYCSEVNLAIAPSEFFRLKRKRKKKQKTKTLWAVSHILFLFLRLFSAPPQ